MEDSLKPDRLLDMLKRQDSLQCDTYGHDLLAMPIELRVGYIRVNVLALESELHEALGETGWKPWTTKKFINTEAYVGELVDAWHFLMNMFLATGLDPDDIAKMLYEGYIAKNKKNAQRQEDGYDGVSTKCPRCKRALDDAAVKCNTTQLDNPPTGPVLDGYCDAEKSYYYWITTVDNLSKVDRRTAIAHYTSTEPTITDLCPRCAKALAPASNATQCYRSTPKFVYCVTQGITTHVNAMHVINKTFCPLHLVEFTSVEDDRDVTRAPNICPMGDEWVIVNDMFRPAKS